MMNKLWEFRNAVNREETGHRKFWTFRNDADRGESELLLYGNIGDDGWSDVSSRTFAEELSALGDITNLTVRINSCGGDVFAAHAIGNLLEQNRATVTCKIDGLCASAATIVACHCDRVLAAEDSVYMIHPVQMYVGYATDVTLTNALSAYKTISKNIVDLYARKSGRTSEECEAWMNATTWWTAEQAAAYGFIDELMASTPIETENRNGSLFVNGVDMDTPYTKGERIVKLMKHEFVEAHGPSLSTLRGPFTIMGIYPIKHDDATVEGEKTVEIKTVDQLKDKYPELCAQIASDAVKAERERIQKIEETQIEGCEDMATEAKFTQPISAEQFAVNALKHLKSMGAQALEQRKFDAQQSGVNEVRPTDTAVSGTNDPFMAALKRIENEKEG